MGNSTIKKRKDQNDLLSDKKIHEYLRNMILTTFSKRGEIHNMGLINGQMGFCINAYELGTVLNDKDLVIVGDTILDEIFSLIQTTTTIDFSDGIVGVGWGIEHLAQRNIIDANTNDILSELDQRLFAKKFFGDNNGLDLQKGFLGMGYYFIKRLHNKNSTDEYLFILKIKQSLIDIIEQLDWAKLVAYPFKSRQEIYPSAEILPKVFLFLSDLHKLDLFNSRVNKIIEWFAQHQALPILDGNIHRLQLLQSIIELDKCVPGNIFSNLISYLGNNLNKECLLLEIERSNNNALVLEIFKIYYRIVQVNDIFEEEYIFWKNMAIEFLENCSYDYKSENALEDVGTVSLLDGLNGFYTIIPHIFSKYQNEESI